MKLLLSSCCLTAVIFQSVMTAGLRVQCYLPEWTLINDGSNPFRISDIASTKACDVIIYAFFRIENNAPSPTNGNKYRQHFAQLNDLKETQPNLELFLGIGGWGSGSDFANMASTAENRTAFAQSVVRTLHKWNFDGVNIDWQFPEPAAAQDHALLLQSLRSAFELDALTTQRSRLKLTTTVSQTVRLGYMPKEIAKYLDGVNVLTYDYKGSWGATVQRTAVNAGLPDIKKSVADWINAGIPPNMVSLGVPFYGRTWTLANDGKSANDTGVGQAAVGPGVGGFLTYDNGTLSYTEICINLKAGWTHKTDPVSNTSYAYSGNQWVNYDDSDSIAAKVAWAKSQYLHGVFIWHIGLDDRQGICGSKFPLLTAISLALGSSKRTQAEAIVILPTTHTNLTTISPIASLSRSGASITSQLTLLLFVTAVFQSFFYLKYLVGEVRRSI